MIQVQTAMGNRNGRIAQYTPEESVKNMATNVLFAKTPEDSGRFFNFTGNEIAW